MLNEPAQRLPLLDTQDIGNLTEGLGGVIDAVAKNWIKGTRDRKEVQQNKRWQEHQITQAENEAAFMRRAHRRASLQNAQLGKLKFLSDAAATTQAQQTLVPGRTTLLLAAAAAGAWLYTRS